MQCWEKWPKSVAKTSITKTYGLSKEDENELKNVLSYIRSRNDIITTTDIIDQLFIFFCDKPAMLKASIAILVNTAMND